MMSLANSGRIKAEDCEFTSGLFHCKLYSCLVCAVFEQGNKKCSSHHKIDDDGSCFTEERASLRSRLIKGKGWGRRKIGKKCGVGGGGGGGVSGVVWNRTVEGPV